MKVGIIRCQLTEDMCPGTTDFKIAREGTLAFTETGPAEIIGFTSCGGCCGKKAITRAKMMVDRGAEAIVFASCMSKGNPIGFACPHFAEIKSAVEKKLGAEIKIIDWTHENGFRELRGTTGPPYRIVTVPFHPGIHRVGLCGLHEVFGTE